MHNIYIVNTLRADGLAMIGYDRSQGISSYDID